MESDHLLERQTSGPSIYLDSEPVSLSHAVPPSNISLQKYYIPSAPQLPGSPWPAKVESWGLSLQVHVIIPFDYYRFLVAKNWNSFEANQRVYLSEQSHDALLADAHEQVVVFWKQVYVTRTSGHGAKLSFKKILKWKIISHQECHDVDISTQLLWRMWA